MLVCPSGPQPRSRQRLCLRLPPLPLGEHPCPCAPYLSRLTSPFPFTSPELPFFFFRFLLNSQLFFSSQFLFIAQRHYTNNKGKKNRPRCHRPVASTALVPPRPSRLVRALSAVIFTEPWFPFCLSRPPDGRGGPGAPSSFHRDTQHVAQELCVCLLPLLTKSLEGGAPVCPCHPHAKHSVPRSGMDGRTIALFDVLLLDIKISSS